MKSGSALWCAFSLFLGALTCSALEPTEAASVPAASSYAVDDQFFADHPDLKDEAEVVAEASRALAAQQYEAGTPKEASEALAAQARAILADRTPEEWQQKAVSLYPALGVAGSEFNVLFLKHYRELKVSSAAFIQEPSWPVLLAKRCDDELRTGHPAVSQPVSAPSSAAAPQALHPKDTASASHTHRSGNFWQTLFALLFLIVLTVVPCALAFRPAALVFLRRALSLEPDLFTFRKEKPQKPTPERPSTPSRDPSIWRAALKHAAIIYVFVALPTSVHSLMANSDLGFVDRVFVSILVGSLFGVFITLPLFGIDTLWHACLKHPTRQAVR
jgi:hypothetical protein